MSDGDRLDKIEERLRDAERVWLLVSRRQDDVEQLSVATDRLAQSTDGVDETLRTVGQALQAAREAKTAADKAQVRVDASVVELARTEHKYRRRSRMLAGTALAVSLLATGGAAAYFVGYTHNQSVIRYQLCQQRRTYDEVNHESVGADITYYQRQLHLIHANKANTAALIRSFPPRRAAAFRLEVRASTRALRAALAAKRKAFAAGIVGQCDRLPH